MKTLRLTIDELNDIKECKQRKLLKRISDFLNSRIYGFPLDFTDISNIIIGKKTMKAEAWDRRHNFTFKYEIVEGIEG